MKESQHTEWKESWSDDQLRCICGFANAEGGTLVIGRDDKGRVAGIANAARLLEELPNKIRDLLGIVIQVNLRREKGLEYLEIETPAYSAPISYRGHYYQRSGSTLQELKGAALDRFLLRRQGRTWDGVPVPGVAIRDLSGEAIKRFRTLARHSRRVQQGSLREPAIDLIDKLRLREGAYLKRAALLLFHEDPERFASGAFVKIGFFRSESDLAYHDEVHGDLFSQVAGTIELLRTKYLKAAVRYEGIQRVEEFPVPDAALREAVLNALVHRDYASTAPTQIRVYDDRLRIWNPAVLPDGWTVETLRRRHASLPFNPEIANTFFRAGEIEAWGRGIERIYQACSEEDLPAPDLRYEANGLWIEFRFSTAYLRIVGDEGKQSVRPDLQPESRPESQPESLELRVLALLRQGSLSKSQIARALGHKTVSGQLNKVIRDLLADGRIEYTLPDTPNSRLQAYRLINRENK